MDFEEDITTRYRCFLDISEEKAQYPDEIPVEKIPAKRGRDPLFFQASEIVYAKWIPM